MRVINFIENSLVDGEGMRFVIFMTGCVHECDGCHAPETWDYFNGEIYYNDEILDMIEEQKDWIDGITLSGGDPLYQLNDTKKFLKKFRERFSSTLDVWLYTGYKFDRIPPGITQYCDIIVDGKYKEHLPSKKFVGSNNQRVLSKQEGTNKFVERHYNNFKRKRT